MRESFKVKLLNMVGLRSTLWLAADKREFSGFQATQHFGIQEGECVEIRYLFRLLTRSIN